MNITLAVKAELERRDYARQQVRIALETRSDPADGETYRTTLAGDTRKLRGIPAIGRNVAGAIDGTTAGTDHHIDTICPSEPFA